MRILPLALIICLSVLTKGQNVLTKFQDTVLYDDFVTNQFNFPQKYNALELLIIENGQYRLQRIKESGHSISYAKLDRPLDAFSIQANIAMVKGSNKEASGGVVLHGQQLGNGAIIVEINLKQRFKITKIVDNQQRYLSGTPKEEGWIKSKAIAKKGINKLEVKVENGYYEVYINNQYVYTAFDTQFIDGRVGFFVNGTSEMLVHDVLISKKAQSFGIVKNNGEDGNSSEIEDPSFQEVILIFKTKIDQQSEEIKQLQKEVDQCKSMLNYDTTLVSRSEELTYENQILRNKLDSTSRALDVAVKRMTYLESFKEDIESASNGDMILNLSNILATIKTENKTLNIENSALKSENAILTKDKEVLLREVDRLKYMLELKD